MQITAYVDLAVRLVNTAGPRSPRDGAGGSASTGDDLLMTVADLRVLLADDPGWRRIANEDDLALIRSLRNDLRAVFEGASLGEESAAVRRLNVLLGTIKVVPRLTGHDSAPWHMHLADGSSSAYAGYASAAIVGLSFYVAEHGFGRLGICRSTPCQHVFLDTSANRSRRFCSDRCASRANVAAFRARQRARPTGTATTPMPTLESRR